MKEGKLNFDDLRNMLKKSKGSVRKEVVVSNDVGEDCAVIDFNECQGIFSTDPITGATKNLGKLAVNINCNDIASSGGEPVALLVTILAPTKSTLEDIKAVMKEISEEAEKINVQIIGGHTEVTSAVNKLIVSITVIGKGEKGKIVKTAGAKCGDDIVVTKNLAIEGTAILINDYEERCRTILSNDEIQEGIDLAKEISVLKEARIAKNIGVNSMHDITEGGLLGALFEVAIASNTGFKVFEDRLPILNVTKKVAKEFSIDPLRLISSGSMLITTSKGEEVVKALEEEGIKATIIGKVTKSKSVLVSNGVELVVEEPKRDELFNIK